MAMDNEYRKRWLHSRDGLISAVVKLGFPKDLGDAIVKNLRSPRAMDRMTSYLENVKPKKAELVVDEMLAIMSEIEAWRDKKSSQEANAAYNEMLYWGLGSEDE